MSLSKDEILAVQDMRREPLDVPEWGGQVYVVALSGVERDSFEQAVMDGRGANGQVAMTNVRGRLAAMTLCDEKGVRLFALGDMDALGAKSAAALDRVFEIAQKLSRIGGEDIEDLVGNSDGGQSDSSGSA